jgi:hypothetical protein
MAATDRITMTMRGLDRFKVIQSVVDGQLKPWQAAERLLLTTRQVRRLAARLREQGPPGLNLNGVVPDNARLDAQNLPKIRMPNRNGFVSNLQPTVR